MTNQPRASRVVTQPSPGAVVDAVRHLEGVAGIQLLADERSSRLAGVEAVVDAALVAPTSS